MQDLTGPCAFLVTKPLQLVVALMIREQFVQSLAKFCIVDSFRGAHAVASRASPLLEGQVDPQFFRTQKEAYDYLSSGRFDHIFIDSDVGLRKASTLRALKRRAPSTKIYVFEEGMGTYRGDLYKAGKRWLFPRLQISTRFGASNFVDRVFLFEPDTYRSRFPDLSHKAIAIASSVGDYLAQHRADVTSLFGGSGLPPADGRRKPLCHLYLSSWKVDRDFIDRFSELPGDCFFKPHPHIIEDMEFREITSMEGGMLAELAIIELAERYERTDVFHHGTSAERYVKRTSVTFSHVDTLVSNSNSDASHGHDASRSKQAIE